MDQRLRLHEHTVYCGLYLTKLQNIGAGDPPSTFSLDGIPVEGVEEFTYLGSSVRRVTAAQTCYGELD